MKIFAIVSTNGSNFGFTINFEAEIKRFSFLVSKISSIVAGSGRPITPVGFVRFSKILKVFAWHNRCKNNKKRTLTCFLLK